MTNRTKNIIIGIVAIILLLSISYFSCRAGRNSVLKTVGKDTTITIDSFRVVNVPIPVGKDSLIYVKGADGKPYPVYVHDTIEGGDIIIGLTDTAAIMASFYEKVYYNETIDSGSVKVTIMDTVTQNRISGRSVDIKKMDSVFKETIVLRPPKNIVGYFTLAGMGNIPKNTYGGGLGLALKTPMDNVYQIEVTKINNTPMLYGGRVFIPIRLLRKK